MSEQMTPAGCLVSVDRFARALDGTGPATGMERHVAVVDMLRGDRGPAGPTDAERDRMRASIMNRLARLDHDSARHAS